MKKLLFYNLSIYQLCVCVCVFSSNSCVLKYIWLNHDRYFYLHRDFTSLNNHDSQFSGNHGRSGIIMVFFSLLVIMVYHEGIIGIFCVNYMPILNFLKKSVNYLFVFCKVPPDVETTVALWRLMSAHDGFSIFTSYV